MRVLKCVLHTASVKQEADSIQASLHFHCVETHLGVVYHARRRVKVLMRVFYMLFLMEKLVMVYKSELVFSSSLRNVFRRRELVKHFRKVRHHLLHNCDCRNSTLFKMSKLFILLKQRVDREGSSVWERPSARSTPMNPCLSGDGTDISHESYINA